MISVHFFFSQVFRIWHRNYLLFYRSWLISLFWIFLEPTVVFLSIGLGLGAFVAQIEGQSYLAYFFPGMVCSAGMMISYFDAAYSGFGKLSHQRTYQTLLLAPVTVLQLVVGEIIWSASKGSLSSFAVCIVGSFFGLTISPWLIPALLVVCIGNLLFASLGLLVTSLVKNYDSIIYPTSGLIVPMSLLSDTYFPTANAPTALKFFIFILPLAQEVHVIRSWVSNTPEWLDLFRIVYLLAILFGLVVLTTKNLHKRLID